MQDKTAVQTRNCLLLDTISAKDPGQEHRTKGLRKNIPIWLMRQAGRYQKEYRDIRKSTNFLSLCKNPNLASEVTVMAQQMLDVDAAIIFADILLILEPLGVGLQFNKGEGPIIEKPVRTESDFSNLIKFKVQDELAYVGEALKLTRRELNPDIALLGFAGAPFTVASYLIEGGATRTFEITKSLMYSKPELFKQLLDLIVDLSVDYLFMQKEAGADAVQIFDSWAGCLSPDDYEKYVFPHSKRLIDAISSRLPVIHFATGNSALYPIMAKANSAAMAVDWRVDLSKTWAQIGFNTAMQGNLDPCVLLADKATIKEKTEVLLKSVQERPNYIFNLGHGILPSTPVDNVKYLVELVRNFRA